MKKLIPLLPAFLVFASCDKNSSAGTPKAVEVREEVVVAVPAQAAQAIEDTAEEAEELAEEAGAPAVAKKSKTPGEHLDQALKKTGEGLQTAGEKTEEGLKTAKEKTEEGLEKAAEGVGGFLKKVGETIEDGAEAAEPEEP